MVKTAFEVHYFHFSHRRKPNAPSSLHVRKTNINEQLGMLNLVYCKIKSSHCRIQNWSRYLLTSYIDRELGLQSVGSVGGRPRQWACI